MVIPLKLLYTECHSASSARNYQAPEESTGKVTMISGQGKKMTAKCGRKKQSASTAERIQSFQDQLPQEKRILTQQNLLCHSRVTLTNSAHRFIKKRPL